MNLKKIGKLFASKFVGTGPSSYKKRIYWAAVSTKVEKHCSRTFGIVCGISKTEGIF
jgi:hypothetical protein